MNAERRKKLEQLTNRIITSYILEELPEVSADFGLIHVTGVKISTDISYLDVFVSSLKNEDTLTKSLAKYAKDIERRLHKDISIRKLPRLRFRYDAGGADSEQVCNIINEITSNL